MNYEKFVNTVGPILGVGLLAVGIIELFVLQAWLIVLCWNYNMTYFFGVPQATIWRIIVLEFMIGLFVGIKSEWLTRKK